MAYRIVSLDGGGIRGILTAVLLERLEAEDPGFLSHVDLFAGTSTGGLLALGLAAGMRPAEARALYELCGRKVFSDTFLDDLRDFGRLVGAEYSSDPLREVLEHHFGDKTLGDLKKRVLIATFDLDNNGEDGRPRTWKPKFFHNYPSSQWDGHERVVDVAIRTSAAPTYFPIYQGFIDGGVIANNPSMCALAQAMHKPTGGQQLDDIVLLSMGTGHNPRYLPSLNGDWGLVQWAPHLLSIMMEGSAGTAEYQCRQILEERFMRVNPRLPHPIELDKLSNIPLLVQIAETYDLREATHWVGRYF